MRSFGIIKSSRIGEIILSFTDIGKSRPSCEFSASQICVLTLILAKISEFTVVLKWAVLIRLNTVH